MADTSRSARTCRWAQPTLFLPLPFWLEAWDDPWTCGHSGTPRPLESTTECSACPRWETRAPADRAWLYSQLGL